MAGQPGLFDLEDRYGALSAVGDPLERLAEVVTSELFRNDLEAALPRSDRVKGGRPPYDPVLMLKILVLQTLAKRPAPSHREELKANLRADMRRLQRTPDKIRAFFRAPTTAYAA